MGFSFTEEVNPKWASVNNGIFICINCAGEHRLLDISFSFVWSLTLDAWNENMLKCMTNGGNKNVKELYDSYDLFNLPQDQWYQTNIAQWNWLYVRLIYSQLKAVALD